MDKGTITFFERQIIDYGFCQMKIDSKNSFALLPVLLFTCRWTIASSMIPRSAPIGSYRFDLSLATIINLPPLGMDCKQ